MDPDQFKRSACRAGVLSLAAALPVLFLWSHGTIDVDIWLNWMRNGLRHGLRAGYAADCDYPPLAFTALYITAKLAGLLGVSLFVALKASLAVAFLATVSLF